MSDIGIIGAGSFGTALAISLAKENHNVNLWARSETQIKEMLELNENKKPRKFCEVLILYVDEVTLK